MPNYGQATPAPTYGQVSPDGVSLSPLPMNPVGINAPADFAGSPPGAGLVLASWSKRAAGGLIDWLPILVLALITRFMNLQLLSFLPGLVGGLYGLFNIGVLGGMTGVSLGRRVAGTKLVDENTLQPIGAGLGIGRYFLHIIDSAIFYVGFLFPLWTKKKQTIADMIVGTIVIEDAPSRY